VQLLVNNGSDYTKCTVRFIFVGVFIILSHPVVDCMSLLWRERNEILEFFVCRIICDRLCGLVVRVPGYRYRGPGFDPRRYQIF